MWQGSIQTTRVNPGNGAQAVCAGKGHQPREKCRMDSLQEGGPGGYLGSWRVIRPYHAGDVPQEECHCACTDKERVPGVFLSDV